MHRQFIDNVQSQRMIPQIEEMNEHGISNLTVENPPVHVRDGNSSYLSLLDSHVTNR